MISRLRLLALALSLLSLLLGPGIQRMASPGTGLPADASPVNVASAVADNSGHIYLLDGFGGLHQTGSAPPIGFSAYWPGWDIARSIALFGDGTGGYVLDGFGGVHPVGLARPVGLSAYWPNWDIARSITLAPWATASDPEGWVLDGFGGIHPFGGAPAIAPSAYWPGWDVARAIVVGGPAASGSAPWGYVLDGYGGLHPFGGAPPRSGAYWPGWEIARSIQLLGGTSMGDPGGYVLDGYGGIHPFGPAPAVGPGAYWPGWDIARSLTLWTGAPAASPGGWVVDGYGGLHAFGSAPLVGITAYWPGWDIARATAGSGSNGAGRTSSRVLSVPSYRQQHNLDCEATTLQMALAWQGIGVSQDTLIAAIGSDPRAPVSDASGWHWGDPYASFVGSVDGSENNYTGYGVYFPPIARVDQQFGGHVETAGQWIPPSEVYQAVLGGRPVIAWVNIDFRYHPASSYVAFDGRPVLFAAPYEHAVVVVGVTTSSVLVNNPVAGQQWIGKGAFEAAYSTYDQMAVILS